MEVAPSDGAPPEERFAIMSSTSSRPARKDVQRRSAMRRAVPAIMSAIVVAGLVLCQPPSSVAQSAGQKQAQCELSAIGGTRSAFALQTIRSACNWLVVNEGSLLNESLRPYYLCLVQNLSGAQSDAAANAIVSACRAANMQ
jgi:hypothetical protein